MAIYLDTNVLRGWRTLAAAERLAVDILAAELGLEIVVPSLVAAEIEGHWRREFEAAADSFYASARKVEVLFDLEPIMTEPVLNVDRMLDVRRRELTDAFRSCPGSGEDALEGLRREVIGEPPAVREADKPGRGARDVAIWMSVVRDHIRRQEPGHFITRDGGFWARDKAHPGLERDTAGAGQPLKLHRSATDFIKQLGRRDEADIELKVVEAALPLIASGLEHLQALPRAVFEVDTNRPDEFEFRTSVTDGAVDAIERAWRFGGSSHEVLLVDARWRLEFTLSFRRNQASSWYSVSDLSARGRVQVYLTDPASTLAAGQFIAAQLKPDQFIWLGDDGSLHVLSKQDPREYF